MRCVAVGVFAHMADAAGVQVLDGRREKRKRGLARTRACPEKRLGVKRKHPAPDGPVVVGGLALRVLVAGIDAAVEPVAGD